MRVTSSITIDNLKYKIEKGKSDSMRSHPRPSVIPAQAGISVNSGEDLLCKMKQTNEKLLRLYHGK